MKHISVKITFLVVIAELMVMAFLFLFLNGRLSDILEQRVLSDMGIIAHHRADLAENYIEGRCDFLNGYARCIEALRVLEDPENPDLIKTARECTDNYAAGYGNIEGLYTATWDTYVLAHTNPDSVDKTFRDADSAKELEHLIKQHQTAFCTGIVQALVTKKMVLPVYCPVQNAGMVVSRNATSELILINQRALTLYGVPYAEKNSLTTKGIRALFSKEELVHIDEQLQKLKEGQDEVLIGIAKAMQDTFRSSDILVRLGGDEFVVYAPGMPDEKVGTMVIDRFIKNVEKISPASIRGHKVTISLGAVMVDRQMSFTEMYNCADSLMYQCKKSGGSAFDFYRI